MTKDKEFKFYENFMRAIDILPEEQRAEACYKFCRFGIYGELPEDEALKMFCIGVSVSVQKYQNCGGNHNPTGKNQHTKNGQVGQVGQVVQTKTKTKTETETETETKRGIPTKEQIEDYCRELGRGIDIDAFIAYYAAGDWLDENGFPIKNWKRKVISWHTRERKKREPEPVCDGLF